MGIRVRGGVSFEQGGKTVTVNAADFGEEQGGRRHMGDGHYRYEALFIASYQVEGDDSEYTISFQAVQEKGEATIYGELNFEAEVDDIEDDLEVEAIGDEPEDEDD